MLTKVDDDGQEFVAVYANWSNNNRKAKCNLYKGECLTIFWAVSSF